VKKSIKKSFNPKAHAPSVYIPCWLLQVSSSKLSHQAKILYGRLAQWSSAKGTVHRSIPQLVEEVGMSKSAVNRTLKELRDVELIDTYQAESGGVNHYCFLEHPWMDDPINKNLEYSSSTPHPTSDTTPTPHMALPRPMRGVPKIKEIKVNKNRAKQIPVDNYKKPATRSSVNLKILPEDFEPDGNGMKELYRVAQSVKMQTVELFDKFVSVHKKYKTRSSNWQEKFIGFLADEKPKKTYEDSTGKKRRYDNKPLY